MGEGEGEGEGEGMGEGVGVACTCSSKLTRGCAHVSAHASCAHTNHAGPAGPGTRLVMLDWCLAEERVVLDGRSGSTNTVITGTEARAADQRHWIGCTRDKFQTLRAYLVISYQLYDADLVRLPGCGKHLDRLSRDAQQLGVHLPDGLSSVAH